MNYAYGTYARRKTTPQYTREAVKLFTRHLLQAVDGVVRHPVYPTAPASASYLGNLFTPRIGNQDMTKAPDDGLGHGVKIGDFLDGIAGELQALVLARVELPDTAEAAMGVLNEWAARASAAMQEPGATASAVMVHSGVRDTTELDGDGVAVWCLSVQAAYPDHPQTPGSARYMAAQAADNPTESRVDGLAKWKTMPGLY